MGDRNAIFEAIEWDLAQMWHKEEAERRGGENVQPSGGDFTTAWTPLACKAAPRFSTTNCRSSKCAKLKITQTILLHYVAMLAMLYQLRASGPPNARDEFGMG
jgi:hypothetical protein